ncbi:MAG: 16S rRNA (cytidine(1402)-2'-O)-methyltransferase [Betaproteobacteria bacterium]|nr:16S rRNA (cytidine(1402)-2'-O)-methyltransferase [Betaproteobacteria bacterium]
MSASTTEPPATLTGRPGNAILAPLNVMSQGTLYIVATPIGNLADASPRALETLAQCDLVACEDTRTTRGLLSRHGISAHTLSLHAHNERSAGERLLEALRQGKRVAVVSDAGTPAISDPGALLVAAAHREGFRVIPIPGPNAAVAAYSASGYTAERFLFAGFLPATRAARRKALADLEIAWPLIFYEAPHRVLETVEDLVERYGADREIVIARELTKMFEEIARMPLGAAHAWLGAEQHRQQGEFVLVLGPGAPQPSKEVAEGERVLAVLLEALSPGEAARLAARISGESKNKLYEKALELAGREKKTVR